MGKMVIFGIIVASLQSKPFLQTMAIAILNLVFFYLLIKQKPFVSKVINLLTTFAGKKFQP